MKILVITSVFPNSKQPTLGVFVKERMFNVAKHCELKVIAPVPWFPLVQFIRKGYRPDVPYLEIQDGIEVYHPRFFNIPKFFKSLDGFFFFISSALTVRKIKRKFNFDVIDSHFAYPDGFGAILLGRLFRRPVAVTIRGTIGKLSRYRLRRLQIKFVLKKAVKVFSVCESLKTIAVGLGIPGEKIVVIPNGVDTEKFYPIERQEARRALGLPCDRKIIISVGGLVERKGFHRIISVLPEIKKTFPDITYLVIGGPSVEGNYEPELRSLVDEMSISENVIFAGPQPHDVLYQWLSASDVFCLATSNEGWANVFLEAMSCGLPVVTTHVGGNEEVISSEDYGLLFNMEDRQELVLKLLRALGKNWDRERIINYAKANSWGSRITSILCHLGDAAACGDNVVSAKRVVQ